MEKISWENPRKTLYLYLLSLMDEKRPEPYMKFLAAKSNFNVIRNTLRP